jgi:Zn-dependent M16 (insulinase) family peptidase
VQEYYAGYEAHLSIKALEENFDAEFDALAERLNELAKRIFTKERLTASICGTCDEEFEKSLVNTIRDGEKYDPVLKIKPLGARREGFIIPAQTSFTALASTLSAVGAERSGTDIVVRSILSYGYLWNTVRVQGGAYGVGLISRNNGAIGFYSYRDPSPARTLEAFNGAAESLRSVAKSGEDITKFIIGAVGESSPLTTPKLKATLAASRFLRGVSYEDECKMRREILETDSAALLRVADVLDKICAFDCITVFGAKEKVESCKNLDSILQI